MEIYIATDFKDRVATGDDLYTITDESGKKKLTPSPTEVSEPGTPLNKAVLQPLADAVQRIDAAAVKYNQYWWRRQSGASSYSAVRSSAWGHGVTLLSGSTPYEMLATRYYNSPTGGSTTDQYATLQYSNGFSIDGSGNVTLISPTTVTVDGSFDSSILRNKYVKGFLGATTAVFYIPASAEYRQTVTYTDNGGTYNYFYQGFYYTQDSSSSYLPQLITSQQNTSYGNVEYISSDVSDTYPHSGTQDGYAYVYIGTIADAALGLNDTMQLLWQNASPTSSFSSQTVQVSSKVYRYYIVKFRANNSWDKMVYAIVVPNDGSVTVNCTTVGDDNSYVSLCARRAQFINSAMDFSAGQSVDNYSSGKGSTNNYCLIPQKIYGIN